MNQALFCWDQIINFIKISIDIYVAEIKNSKW